jgi:hypothetical protein
MIFLSHSIDQFSSLLSSQSHLFQSAGVTSGFLFTFVPAIQLRDMLLQPLGLHACV